MFFRNKNRVSRQEGLSLIEVIIAMFLIVVLFITYLAALNTVALVRKNTYEDIAYHIANKQMEALREVPFASLTNTSSSISDPMLSSLPSGSGTYTVANYASYTGLKEITVDVSWNDGKAKQVEVKTLAGSGGINP